MVTCSGCNRVVDETTHTTCPHCFAPLGGQAPVARVSLTGEVVAQAPAQPPPANYAPPGSPAPAGSRPMAPPIQQSRLRPSSQPRGREPDHSARKALMINLGVVLLLILAGSGYGWWRWTHRTDPKSQVVRYLHVIQWLDWGVVYDLSAEPPGGMSRHEFINKMDDKFDYNGVIRIGARHALERYKCTVGEPQINGDDATVQATISSPMSEPDRTVQFKLHNFNGVWKIYPLGANPLVIIQGPEAEHEKTFGVPEIPKIPSTGIPGYGG